MTVATKPESSEELRARVRRANALAFVAIVLALTGGTAWAASRYLITSTRQIKPGVLAQIENAAVKKTVTFQNLPGAQGPQGLQGQPGAAGPAGPAGLPVGFAATSSADVTLDTADRTPATAASLALPAGRYVVTGRAQLAVVGDGGSEIRGGCSLEDTSATPTTVDSATALLVANFGAVLVPYQGTADLPLAGIIDTTSESTLSLVCAGSNPMGPPEAQGAYVTDAVLTAVQVMS